MDLTGPLPSRPARHPLAFDGAASTTLPRREKTQASIELGAQGDVLATDADASALLAHGAPLSVDGGRLLAAGPATTALLRAAITAVSGQGGVSEVVLRLVDPAGGPPSSWRLTPRWEGGGAMLCLLAAADTRDTEDPARCLARRGFTPAESACALLLADGLGIDQMAARLAVSRNTVRAHLRSLYAKTATHRQVALAAVVNRALGRDGG